VAQVPDDELGEACRQALVGAAGDAQDAGPGTDFHAVAAGRVSITPLQVDLSQHQQLPLVAHWLTQ